MKQKIACVALVLISLAALVLAWGFLDSSGPEGPAGYPLACPHCDHFFTLDENALYTHPKSPTGEGFQCPKCSRFGARIASRCDRCGQWAVMQEGPDGNTFCPKCAKAGESE